MLWIMPALLGGALALAPQAAPSDARPAPLSPLGPAALIAPDRHVRTTNARIRELLEHGVKRSSTFQRLVAALNASDVIVYVEPTMDLPASQSGRLLLIPVQAGRFRYLRVEVASDLSTNDLIALIGHELRHALEIAEAPQVRDMAALTRLYKRIGQPGAGRHSFDTRAAQAAGRQVRSELG